MDKNKVKYNGTGFTLIELVIYTASFIIIAALLTLFIFNFINVQAKIKISKEILENSQRAMEIILGEIKHSQSVYTSTSVFDSHPGQLSLKTSQNPPAGEETTFLDFYLDNNGRLCLKREGAEAQVLTSEKVKINNLVFNYLTVNNSRSIRIELSAVYGGPSEKIHYQATTTLISSANLRND